METPTGITFEGQQHPSNRRPAANPAAATSSSKEENNFPTTATTTYRTRVHVHGDWDERTLSEFHRDIITPLFDPSEREEWEVWKAYFDDTSRVESEEKYERLYITLERWPAANSPQATTTPTSTNPQSEAADDQEGDHDASPSGPVVVGGAHLELYKNVPVGYLAYVAVRPEKQGKGHSKTLLNAGRKALDDLCVRRSGGHLSLIILDVMQKAYALAHPEKYDASKSDDRMAIYDRLRCLPLDTYMTWPGRFQGPVYNLVLLPLNEYSEESPPVYFREGSHPNPDQKDEKTTTAAGPQEVSSGIRDEEKEKKGNGDVEQPSSAVDSCCVSSSSSLSVPYRYVTGYVREVCEVVLEDEGVVGDTSHADAFEAEMVEKTAADGGRIRFGRQFWK